MSRVFVGVAQQGSRKGEVWLDEHGQRHDLTRRVRGKHVGYSWDQAGPESTELGRAMLWLVTGLEPPWALYRGFTSDIVAHLPLPPCVDECWRLSEQDIRAWLHEVGWLNTQPEQRQATSQAGLRL